MIKKTLLSLLTTPALFTQAYTSVGVSRYSFPIYKMTESSSQEIIENTEDILLAIGYVFDNNIMVETELTQTLLPYEETNNGYLFYKSYTIFWI